MQLHQQLAELVVFAQHDVFLLDTLDRQMGFADGNTQRIRHVFAREVDDVRWQRRREQQRLALSGHLGQNFIDLDAEAHVEHTVGFIEHQEVGGRELYRAARKVIVDTARGADDEARACAELTQLFRHRIAADEQCSTDTAVGAEQLLEQANDLHRELAGWGHDECAGGWVGDQMGDQRDAEGAGFAGAGLRRAENIAASHCMRDCLSLDRGRGGEFQVRERLHQHVGQAQRFKVFHCNSFYTVS